MPYQFSERFKVKHREYRTRNKRFIYNYLKSHPCIKCGFSDIRALDFDHIDKTTKKRNVKALMNGTSSIDSLTAEIEKCQVLCANCHRIKTIENKDFRSSRNQPSKFPVTYS